MKYKFIDLFAGIGGFHQAFKGLAECVFASEIDKYCRITYEANHGMVPHGDITKIDAKDIPPHDILCAGFPCQSFSIAGKRRGFNDTRGTMFFEIVRIVKHHMPQVLFLENVKGLESHNGGKTFDIIRESIKSLGYDVRYHVLNARDYGVPQNRERIFIVAIRKDINRGFDFPKRIPLEITPWDILEDTVDTKYTISDEIWAGHKRRKESHKSRGNGFGYTLINEDYPWTNTLSARYYKDGSEILIEQSGNPRKLTPRECARFQGYPDTFIIPVSDTQAYKQFGNSVAVPVIRMLAKKIIESLEIN